MHQCSKAQTKHQNEPSCRDAVLVAPKPRALRALYTALFLFMGQKVTMWNTLRWKSHVGGNIEGIHSLARSGRVSSRKTVK